MMPEVFILLKNIKKKVGAVLAQETKPATRQGLIEILNEINDFVWRLENENNKKKG